MVKDYEEKQKPKKIKAKMCKNFLSIQSVPLKSPSQSIESFEP